MSDSNTNDKLCERFLDLLGIERRSPSIEALTEVVGAFVTRVPFENISKLYNLKRYGLRGIPEFEMYLDGLEHYNFGGTCYPNNYHLHLLLEHLGYEASLCGAAMNNPDVHLTNLVSIDGREFFIDVGYAAPFLKPMPRDLEQDYVVESGKDRYVLKPRASDGTSRLDLYRDGELKHGYTVNPTPRKIDHFARVIEDSFRADAVFLNSLLLVRQYPNRSVSIRNLSIIEAEGRDSEKRRLAGREELPAIVEELFSIPGEIVSEAVASLGDLGDPWT